MTRADAFTWYRAALLKNRWIKDASSDRS